jgi:hypothetical protein
LLPHTSHATAPGPCGVRRTRRRARSRMAGSTGTSRRPVEPVVIRLPFPRLEPDTTEPSEAAVLSGAGPFGWRGGAGGADSRNFPSPRSRRRFTVTCWLPDHERPQHGKDVKTRVVELSATAEAVVATAGRLSASRCLMAGLLCAVRRTRSSGAGVARRALAAIHQPVPAERAERFPALGPRAAAPQRRTSPSARARRRWGPCSPTYRVRPRLEGFTVYGGHPRRPSGPFANARPSARCLSSAPQGSVARCRPAEYPRGWSKRCDRLGMR